MKIPIFQVDTFTSSRFRGNPAAVCPLEDWLGVNLMQKIAAENNLSETAFFVKENDKFHIRWFTPKTEVNLCGHATLAAASVAFEKIGIPHDTISFHSKSGLLKVTKSNLEYCIDFPADFVKNAEHNEELISAVGIPPNEIYKSREDYMLVYQSEQDIQMIEPDFKKLAGLTKRGLIVTATGNHADFVSRFFAPAIGIDEDPVTGSSHICLTTYWSERLKKKELKALQISSRGGQLNCKLDDQRVLISGNVAFYMEGLIEV